MMTLILNIVPMAKIFAYPDSFSDKQNPWFKENSLKTFKWLNT
mgnify:FL=1